MNASLRALLDKIATTPDFFEMPFLDVNESNSMGDNALHCVVTWGDLDAARLLIEAGVEVNKYGDLGYTPLHQACAFGHMELVKFLVSCGADLHAQTEGNLPFTVARLSQHDSICDYLSPLMLEAQAKDRHVYIKSRISQLKREIAALEAQLGE
jgi:ankyrin repeat protein